MLSVNHTAKLLFFLFIFTAPLFSQQDTTVASDPIITDEPDDTVFVMSKSPWGAVLRSAVVPGLGQIYNESYIKAAVVWGVGAWLVYNWMDNNDNYKTYQRLYNEAPEGFNLKANYLSYRNFYRDNRDLFTIYLGLTYILQLVDAYVDAHLFDFTVEEDFLTRSPMFNIRMKIF